MKKIIYLLLLIQSGFLMAQTETVITLNGKKVKIYPDWLNNADNGLTAVSGNIQLGGSLIKPSILTTTSDFTFAIGGLQTGDYTGKMLVLDSDDVLKAVPILPFRTWKILGNKGTNAENHFVGTLDDQPLQFKINSTNAGKLSTVSTALGYNALNPLSTGIENTAMGISALAVNTTGFSNTAAGNLALSNNAEGDSNTALGSQALRSNTTGSANTAVGANALDANTTGVSNTAVGNAALAKNTTGNYNTGVGWQSLTANTTGNNNTAVGYRSLSSNTTGSENTAVGSNALAGNLSGSTNIAIGESAMSFSNAASNNIAIGASALQMVTTGNDNVVAGFSALKANTTGSANVTIGQQGMYSSTTAGFNTAIGSGVLLNLISGFYNVATGYLAGSSYGSSSRLTASGNSVFLGSQSKALDENQTNQIVIGFNTVGKGSNTAQVGNTYMTSIGGQVAWSNPSDLRLKKDIQNSEFGSNFINKLRPVTYLMKSGTTDLQTGFIAQEVEAAADAIDYEFSGVLKPETDADFYSLRYSEFVVPLVKTVQEQEKKLADKEARIIEIEKELNQLEKVLNELASKK